MDLLTCFISKGKYSLLNDVVKEFFPGNKDKLEVSKDLLDERGDLIVMGGGKSYLLLRQ